jgi:hypothetical protein
MQGLNELEHAVLKKLLAGDHPLLAVLRRQAERARVVKRQNTGVGFFCDFDVDDGTPAVNRDLQIGDVHAEMDGLAHGAGFVLFVQAGRLSMLEGFTYDEPWPEQSRGFSLSYLDPERKSELAKLG